MKTERVLTLHQAHLHEEVEDDRENLILRLCKHLYVTFTCVCITVCTSVLHTSTPRRQADSRPAAEIWIDNKSHKEVCEKRSKVKLNFSSHGSLQRPPDTSRIIHEPHGLNVLL